ncbi:MAG: double zinc ribbon domain-containing protein [Gemmatimonadota bacterium]
MPTLLQALGDLLFAPVCLGCDEPIAPGDTARLVCRRCRAALRAPPAPVCARCGAPRRFTGRAHGPTCPECQDWPPWLRCARAACLLAPPADRLVHQLKYRGWPALAGPMGARMAAVVLPGDVLAELAGVVAVPTTPARRRARGYNQAGELARSVAEHLEKPLLDVMERTPSARSQTGLQPAARGANVAGAFRVRRGGRGRVAAAHLLLVDDILTTGATAIECARALVDAGARCVTVLTFARALDARRLTST